MARLVAVVLLLSLAVAPAVSAQPPSRGESLVGGWFDAFWGALDRVFSWLPTVRSEPRGSGAYINLSGVASPPDGASHSVGWHRLFTTSVSEIQAFPWHTLLGDRL